MDTLTWKTARIVGHPVGDIWAVVSAHHFAIDSSDLDTISAAALLVKSDSPAGGLIAEYLFCEALERAALAAEIEVAQAKREFLRCSCGTNVLQLAHAEVEAARLRYFSDMMSALVVIADANAARRCLPYGDVVAAILGQLGDNSALSIISWGTGHDG
jgi:pyruvoyl-dependent arginine decarboxylase (PvlArgDC)